MAPAQKRKPNQLVDAKNKHKQAKDAETGNFRVGGEIFEKASQAGIDIHDYFRCHQGFPALAKPDNRAGDNSRNGGRKQKISKVIKPAQAGDFHRFAPVASYKLKRADYGEKYRPNDGNNQKKDDSKICFSPKKYGNRQGGKSRKALQNVKNRQGDKAALAAIKGRGNKPGQKKRYHVSDKQAQRGNEKIVK